MAQPPAQPPRSSDKYDSLFGNIAGSYSVHSGAGLESMGYAWYDEARIAQARTFDDIYQIIVEGPRSPDATDAIIDAVADLERQARLLATNDPVSPDRIRESLQRLDEHGHPFATRVAELVKEANGGRNAQVEAEIDNLIKDLAASAG